MADGGMTFYDLTRAIERAGFTWAVGEHGGAYGACVDRIWDPEAPRSRPGMAMGATPVVALMAACMKAGAPVAAGTGEESNADG